MFEKKKVGGHWSEHECLFHINVLELLAIKVSITVLLELLAIKVAITVLLEYLKDKHILIQSDSSTAVSYISDFGGINSKDCNMVAKVIWQICIDNNIWLMCLTTIFG